MTTAWTFFMWIIFMQQFEKLYVDSLPTVIRAPSYFCRLVFMMKNHLSI